MRDERPGIRAAGRAPGAAPRPARAARGAPRSAAPRARRASRSPALERERERRLGLEEPEGPRGEERLLGAGRHDEEPGAARAASRASVRVPPMPTWTGSPTAVARLGQPLTDPPLVAEERAEPAEVEAEAAGLHHLHARRGRPRDIEQRAGGRVLGLGIRRAQDEIGHSRRGLGRAHARARPRRPPRRP